MDAEYLIEKEKPTKITVRAFWNNSFLRRSLKKHGPLSRF